MYLCDSASVLEVKNTLKRPNELKKDSFKETKKVNKNNVVPGKITRM